MSESAPLREPTFLILAALGPEPLHGYGIIKAVQQMSSGRLKLRAGTLYGALERLQAQGYIEPAGEGSDGGPARQYYRITEAGKSLLSDEAARMAANARVAFTRLGISPA